MKRNSALLLLLLLPLTVIANDAQEMNPYNALSDQAEQGLCKDLYEQGIYLEMIQCSYRLQEDSEQKLKQQLDLLNNVLKTAGDTKRLALLAEEQAEWEKYRATRCRFRGLHVIPESRVYYDWLATCQAAENYRRIETLDSEPGMP
ncbi:lysozyme inhibitor LprI family protein [Dickeya undicola]|uniref:lysozyme inhibitor LprI family protein n=1 Tax=Dickeya undicola TaxID=1577887 RepID=UPI003F243338